MKKRMLGLLSALLIVSLLLTGCLGKGTEVDERKQAEEGITALINRFVQTYRKDPDALFALHNYPMEVTVKRGTDGEFTKQTVNSAAELAALVRHDTWKKDYTGFTQATIQMIDLDSKYQNGVVQAQLLWGEANPPKTYDYEFEVIKVNGKWLFVEYLYLITIDE